MNFEEMMKLEGLDVEPAKETNPNLTDKVAFVEPESDTKNIASKRDNDLKEKISDKQNDGEEKSAEQTKIVVSANDLQKFENSSAYKIKLENFEGPLDLLLYLIKDSKVEIEDIKLSEVTDQYLEYMKDLDKIDMEKAAEFIDIAATLIEIKSKHLLPSEQPIEVDEQDDEKILLMRLKEYKLFKEASEKLKQQENVNRLYKQPDEKVNDFRIILKQMNVDNLISAFTKMLSKANLETAIEETKTIERDRWTVEEKQFEIKTLVSQKGILQFSEIVSVDFTRGEIITTFMALLELLKRQQIIVSQYEQFGEITIEKGENIDG